MKTAANAVHPLQENISPKKEQTHPTQNNHQNPHKHKTHAHKQLISLASIGLNSLSTTFCSTALKSGGKVTTVLGNHFLLGEHHLWPSYKPPVCTCSVAICDRLALKLLSKNPDFPDLIFFCVQFSFSLM